MPLYPAVSLFSGVGGVAISTANRTISISGWNINHFEPLALLGTGTSTFNPVAGSWYFDPFQLQGNLSGGRLNRLYSFAGTASVLRVSSVDFQSNSTGSKSVSLSYVHSVALYTLGAGANSTRLESMWSNSFSVGLAQSVSVSSAANRMGATMGVSMSYIASINSLGAYTTTSTTASQSASSTNTTLLTSNGLTASLSSLRDMLTGEIVIPVGFNTTITPGNYWLAKAYSFASTTGANGGATLTGNLWSGAATGIAFGVILYTGLHRIWGKTLTSSGSQMWPGNGVFSAASAAPPATVAFSDIRTGVGNILNYFNIVNSTI